MREATLTLSYVLALFSSFAIALTQGPVTIWTKPQNPIASVVGFGLLSIIAAIIYDMMVIRDTVQETIRELKK